MESPQKYYLALILLILAGVSGLLIWSFAYNGATHFQAGVVPMDVFAPPAKPAPRPLPLRVIDPSRGSEATDAVVIIEYADYASAYSRTLEEQLRKVLVEQSTPVKLVWRDFIIPSDNPEPSMAAVAARCAGDQGKFWEMHDALLQSETLDVATLKKLAAKLKLGTTVFNKCLESPKKLQALGDDVAEELKNNIATPPTFFIGDQPYTGVLSAEQIGTILWNVHRKQ